MKGAAENPNYVPGWRGIRGGRQEKRGTQCIQCRTAHATVLCYAPPVSESQERPRGRRFAIADREAILGDRRISGRARMVAALCGNLRSPAREKLELHCG